MTATTCRICRNSAANKTFCFQEKMFGTGGELPYFQCAQCGCLQIAAVPDELSRYYPSTYYSFHLQPIPRHGIKAWLAGKRDLSAVTGKGLLGRCVGKWIPARPDVACLGEVPLRRGMRILDVGCGKGQLLSILHRAGFRHLAGVDPFLPADFEVLPGLTVRKLALETVPDQFDLIMLHHVFEHVQDGRQMLAACRERLAAGGRLLLRIPVVDSAAWERYQENWVQLDAPRHLFLHTRSSLTNIAHQAGLKVISTRCDSSAFQFWASELYQRGVPLMDSGGQQQVLEAHFSKHQIKDFAKQAVVLNASNRGDQIVAILANAAS